jgi:hypothetical protein
MQQFIAPISVEISFRQVNGPRIMQLPEYA